MDEAKMKNILKLTLYIFIGIVLVVVARIIDSFFVEFVGYCIISVPIFILSVFHSYYLEITRDFKNEMREYSEYIRKNPVVIVQPV
jgi:hypothetical protein